LSNLDRLQGQGDAPDVLYAHAAHARYVCGS